MLPMLQLCNYRERVKKFRNLLERALYLRGPKQMLTLQSMPQMTSVHRGTMEDYIRIMKVPGGRPVFVDLEDDGTLLLETLQSQFGTTAIGLCYSFQEGCRSVRVKNGACLAPKTGWGSITYKVVRPPETSVEGAFIPTVQSPTTVPLQAESVLMRQSTSSEYPRSQST